MSTTHRNQIRDENGSRRSAVMKRGRLSSCCMFLMTLTLSACGEPPSGPEVTDSAVAAVDETEQSDGNVIVFLFGDQQPEFPANPCMVMPSLVIVTGQEGETVLNLLHDDRPKVEYRHHFERDGVRYWNLWNSKRDDIEYSVDGSTVTASGTMGNTNQWKEAGRNGGWQNVAGSYRNPDDQAFTVSATCN